MVQTEQDFLEMILTENWTPMITDRELEVPEPDIYVTTDEDTPTRTDPGSVDVIYIREGSADYSPKTVNWQHEEVNATPSIDMRTTEGRKRLVGTRREDGTKERYGGLAGEVKRCLDIVRRGRYEYDWAATPEFRPLSEDMGYGTWRGVWETRLTELARPINPDPEL